MDLNRRSLLAFAVASAPVGSIGLLGNRAVAATAEDLNRDAAQALQTLYRSNPVAVKISKIAKAELVFPNIVKAGLIFGGGYGEGVLMEGSKVVEYYNSINGSWGLQAGAQSYGYVVFLMTDKAMSYLQKSKGWEIGVGPTVVLVTLGRGPRLPVRGCRHPSGLGQSARLHRVAKYQRVHAGPFAIGPLRFLDRRGDYAVQGRLVAHRVGVGRIARKKIGLATAAAQVLELLGTAAARLLHPPGAAKPVEAVRFVPDRPHVQIAHVRERQPRQHLGRMARQRGAVRRDGQEHEKSGTTKNIRILSPSRARYSLVTRSARCSCSREGSR